MNSFIYLGSLNTAVILWYKFDILPSKLFSLLGGKLTFFVDIEDVRKTMGRGKDVLFGYETASTFMNPLCVTVFRIFSQGYHPWLLCNASSFINLTIHKCLSCIDRISTPYLLIKTTSKKKYMLNFLIFFS